MYIQNNPITITNIRRRDMVRRLFLAVFAFAVAAFSQPLEERVPRLYNEKFSLDSVFSSPDSALELYWDGQTTGLFVPLATNIYNRPRVSLVLEADKWIIFEITVDDGGVYQPSESTFFYCPLGGQATPIKSFSKNSRWGGSIFDSIVLISDNPSFQLDYRKSEKYQNGYYWTSRRCLWSPDNGCQFDTMLSSSWTPPSASKSAVRAAVAGGGKIERMERLNLLGRTLHVRHRHFSFGERLR